MTAHPLVLVVVGAGALLAIRLYLVLPRHDRPARRHKDEKCSLGVFLGSGGHTAEMIALLSGVDKSRYTPRTYVYCRGDSMSVQLVSDLEQSQQAYSLLALPRARRVGQSWISTLGTALWTLLWAVHYTFFVPLRARPSQPWVDVLLVNGPGTCVVLVLVMYIRRVLGLHFTRIIYVESFARVKSLSLSGRLLRPLVDTFVVQWPGASEGDQVTYRGWLV